ncbi:hypothetical protein H103_01463 [Trichophyton rubrum CBS 288.86]|uniref:Uncharacterized protein n=2 Tax=Trichophyton TaxID=5550 RepID=A0A022WDE0_TRIRU|nr:hypothetical protein H100_01456 [Trichophyton rubrum MR850]EZF45423.1 hypothetical protein H102_01451 [Trichophyton rubrum CBS 100081]EZF56083.1 hypothetical protein H103_01463 [Trichophyton rubrum CBS 288.86]EZF66695.1 hypothetical protein H104_01441 [Trichophyton rubrum CBS 289.86]EZF77472.1 hypothetical protein H105_01469 [Trichophyton soudanense CBS 452.61]EZG20319.1 hypothetical protein H107_01511 [Trichophyton rubrum CBS 202.88]
MHACKCVQETTSEAFSFAWELEGGLIGSKTGDPGQAKGRGIRYDKAGGGGFKSAGSMEPDLRLLLRPRPKANRIGRLQFALPCSKRTVDVDYVEDWQTGACIGQSRSSCILPPAACSRPSPSYPS